MGKAGAVSLDSTPVLDWPGVRFFQNTATSKTDQTKASATPACLSPGTPHCPALPEEAAALGLESQVQIVKWPLSRKP